MDMYDYYQLSYELENCPEDELDEFWKHWGLDRPRPVKKRNVAIENEESLRVELEELPF